MTKALWWQQCLASLSDLQIQDDVGVGYDHMGVVLVDGGLLFWRAIFLSQTAVH